MVEKINIPQLLNPSHSIGEDEKNRLKLLKEEFPWSVNIRIAYLKALKDTQDLTFSSELRNVALITTDRAQLFRVLYSESIQKTIEKVEKEMDDLPEVEGLIPANWKKVYSTDSNEEIAVEANTPVIKISPINEPEVKELPKEVAPEHLIESPLAEVKLAPEVNHEEIQEEEKEAALSSSSELDKLIISEAIDTSITLDVIHDIEETKKASKKHQNVKKEDVKEVSSISSDDFINWLITNAKAVSYPSFNSDIQHTEPINTDSIIDRFIQNEPQISRGKSKEYSLKNLAAESLVDNEEFITETLAEIYASQGNNSKAKRAFQLLSLKYPEKSIYFAARIKRLGRKK